MGSSSKKYKDKDTRKRRHEVGSDDQPKEKRHKHKKHHHHHKEKKRDRSSRHEYEERSSRHEYDERSSRHEYEERSSKHQHEERSRHEYDERPSKHSYDARNDQRYEGYASEDSDVLEVRQEDYTKSSSSHSRTPVEQPVDLGSSQRVESMSVEDTNKLRAQLGLKPLDVGTSTSSKSHKEDGYDRKDEKKKDDLGEFYHKPAENLQRKAEQEKIKAKLAEIREKRILNNKYGKIKTLGDSDEDEDAEAWINKNRKIEEAKKEAEKRAKMLEELDAQFGIGDVVQLEQRERMRNKYSEKDLKGMTIEHNIDSFAEERDIILTLKDKGVLEEDEDVLVNVNMLDDERYKKSIENKKKKTAYNPYDFEEFDELGNPIERSLLEKYDEEIDGVKKDSFQIGYDSLVERKQQAAVIDSVKAKLVKKKLESIGETQLKIASEYYTDEEMAKFKKPKKKVRKIRSKGKLVTEDEVKPDNSGIESIGSRRPKVKQESDFEIDDVPAIEVPTDLKIEDDDKDDILERALHKARKIKQKENIVAEIIKTEIKPEPEEENVDSGNIILNATAEFCRTLGDIPTYGKAGNREETEAMIDYEKEMETEENSDDDCEIIESTGWNSVDPTNQAIDSTQLVQPEAPVLGEEPDVSTGVGAALKLAMSKGYLDKEQNNRPSNTRLAHLQAKHYSIEDKSYGEDGERQGRRERFCGPITEFREKDSFKPNVKLEYIDDDGHLLNSKEAFRYLSHKFHGKGPGKNKIEKRIKKSVQEQLMKKMSSTDTPLGTLNMLQAKQKETQSAYVVLSGSKQAQSTALSKTRR